MKAKELKDILDRLPDDAEVRVGTTGYKQFEASIKAVRAEITLFPSPGEDFNKTAGRIYIYI